MSTECISNYLQPILETNSLNKVVKNLSKIIKRKVGVDNFDAIAYRGMSGAGVATTLGYILKKPLIMVRKNTTDCHSSSRVEGVFKSKRVLVVDDCISTGNTIVTMVRDIINYRKNACHNEPLEVVAVLLYNDSRGHYNLTTDANTFAQRFFGVIYDSIASDDTNFKALESMMNMKVYNFSLEKKENRFKTVIGSNLVVDDLK